MATEFVMKSASQIEQDFLDYVTTETDLTDETAGSVLRTMAQAFGLGLGEFYVQLAALKAHRDLAQIHGEGLDELGVLYDVKRKGATRSTGSVKFGDSTVTTKFETTLGADVLPGANPHTSITVADNVDSWPASGFIILNRGNGDRERIEYTARSGTTITVPSINVSNSHQSGDSVILSQQGFDRVINSGTSVYADPLTENTDEVVFLTQANVTLFDGDVFSAAVSAISVRTGKSVTIGANRLKNFTALPWSTATVTNDAATSPAIDRQKDPEYRTRLRYAVQKKNLGTLYAVQQYLLGLQTDDGNYMIHAMNVQVPVLLTERAKVYIHDGSLGTTIDFYDVQNVTTTEVLIKNAANGQLRAKTAFWPLVNGSLKLHKPVTGGGYAAYGTGTGSSNQLVNDDGSSAWTTNFFATMILIDDNHTEFTITSNTSNTLVVSGTPATGPFMILDNGGTALVDGTDFFVNESRGELELASGLSAGEWLIAFKAAGNSYQYHGGLIGKAQKVLNGDPADLETFPGVAADGHFLQVLAPTISSQDVVLSISPEPGVAETDELRDLVRQAVNSYIQSLQIGETFVLAEVYARSQQVPGVLNTRITSPTSDVQVLTNELFRATNGIVTIS